MPRKNRGNRRLRYQKSKSEKKINEQDPTYKRIIKLLQIYDRWTKQNDRKNIYSLVCEYYDSSNIYPFLKDYDYIIKNIDVHKKYLKYHGKCAADYCLYLKRSHRNTLELSKDNKKRVLLYNGINDQNQITVIQYIDIIHNIISSDTFRFEILFAIITD